MEFRSCIGLALAPILWGGALVAGRVATVSMAPVTITWARFVLVTLFLLPILRSRERSFPRPDRKELLLIALLTGTGVVLYNYFLFTGLRTVPAVRASVLMALTPSIVAVLQALLLRERQSPVAVVGIATAFSGAVVTITNGSLRSVLGSGVSAGDLSLLAAACCWALYTMIGRRAMARLSALAVFAYTALIGAVVLTPLALRRGAIAALTTLPANALFALLYLSIGAAGIAYLLYQQGVRDVGSTRAAVFLNLEPPAAMLLGVVILGERLTAPVVVGAVLVMTGLYLVNRPSSSDGT